MANKEGEDKNRAVDEIARLAKEQAKKEAAEAKKGKEALRVAIEITDMIKSQVKMLIG